MMKMPSSTDPAEGQKVGEPTTLDLTTVRDALAVAVRAPSIHNTQPWQFELHDGVLALRADRTRQLGIADPDGHSLLISCGAALALTELALRAAGLVVEITRLPDHSDPDLLAQLRAVGRAEPTQLDLDRVAASQRRRSERRPFAPGQPAHDVIERLRRAAASPGVFTDFPHSAEDSIGLAVAVSYADRYQRRDADYLAEMARWTGRDADTADGIPATSIPHVAPGELRHTDVPVRDFEAGIPGAQLINPGTDEQPLLAVIFTTIDGERERLQTGEAMMKLMIEADTAGLASCPLSQAVDMLAFRLRLQTIMNWTDYPQMMLRLGNPPPGEPAPLTPRRSITDVLTTR